MTMIFKDYVTPAGALVIYIYCSLLIVLSIVEFTQNLDLHMGHIPIDDARHSI
jgi:hypothetical protein